MALKLSFSQRSAFVRIDFGVTPQTFARNATHPFVLLLGVQIRQGDICGLAPRCRSCLGTRKMHRHGRSPRKGLAAGLQRYRCPWCHATVSVLEEGMLPYRKITTAELEQCLDDPGSLARTAPPSRRRILRDAVRSFHRHLPQLRVRLGALLGIRSVESPLDQAWRNLRLLFGGIEEILGVLASTFGTSLLRSYRNLERWPVTKHA